jgi:arylsulfatase A-like enzyme
VLEAEGLAANTIVVFFGDNGRCHVRDKQFCYEEGSARAADCSLAEKLPGAGRLSVRFGLELAVSAVDFAPTMLALVGAEVPAKMQGSVFLGDRAAAPRSFVFGARDRCDTTEMTIRTVCDARYRYISRETPGGLLLLAPRNYKETQIQSGTCSRSLTNRGGSRRRRLLCTDAAARAIVRTGQRP